MLKLISAKSYQMVRNLVMPRFWNSVVPVLIVMSQREPSLAWVAMTRLGRRKDSDCRVNGLPKVEISYGYCEENGNMFESRAY